MSNRDEDEGRRAAQGCLVGIILALLLWLTIWALWILR